MFYTLPFPSSAKDTHYFKNDWIIIKEKLFHFCLLNLAAQFREILVKDKSSDVQDPGCLRGKKAFQKSKGKALREQCIKLIDTQ